MRASHLAYDLGAAELAGTLADACKAPLFLASVSRLVADCNRSVTHPRLFSQFSRTLPPMEKEAVLGQWYLPYRAGIHREVQNAVSRTGHCLHLSVHTFTPQLQGRERNADLGLLYDPSRSQERRFARFLAKEMHTEMASCRVRCNYPYRGGSDGLTTALRRCFAERQYLGIELELNQGLLCREMHWPKPLLQAFTTALTRTIAVAQLAHIAG